MDDSIPTSFEDSLSGSGSNSYLGALSGLLSGAGTLAAGLKGGQPVEKRIPTPTTQQPQVTSTMLYIGGAILALIVILFALKK